MLHNSLADFYPALVVKTHGVYQVRFNITEGTVIGPDEVARKVWNYEYAETPTFEYGPLVDAIISTHYSKDAELAMLNKGLANPADPEYAEYNAFRLVAKEAARAALAAGVNP